MKKKPSRSRAASPRNHNSAPRIHPVIIFPFRPPADFSDVEELYRLVEKLDGERETYARPITVIDYKTVSVLEGNRTFSTLKETLVDRHSDLIEAWCVDTCQMWYTGLGRAFQQGKPGDTYWLIPGDFNYGTPAGKGVLETLHDLPEICEELNQDLCVGEIVTNHGNAKHLIDTYGTFALLYNWFPREAREIRDYTERPRSEFFAIRHDFLHDLLLQRWYAYEQTVVMLLKAVMGNRSISRFHVGQISDLPEGRESLASALQQIERTERVLKSVWREQHETRSGWIDEYRALEAQSEQILRAAIVILGSALL